MRGPSGKGGGEGTSRRVTAGGRSINRRSRAWRAQRSGSRQACGGGGTAGGAYGGLKPCVPGSGGSLGVSEQGSGRIKAALLKSEPGGEGRRWDG